VDRHVGETGSTSNSPASYSTVCFAHDHAAIRHPAAVQRNTSVPVACSLTRLPICVKVYVMGSTVYAWSPEMMSC